MQSILEIRNDVLELSSPSFNNQENIPIAFTCDGINVNPCLRIKHLPDKTKSMAIIVEDIDAPISSWSHWVMWDIPPAAEIKQEEAKGIQGINDFGTHAYAGPCPLSGRHEYHYKIFALDCLLYLHPSTNKYHLEKAMKGHILAQGLLSGYYKKKTTVLKQENELNKTFIK